MINASERFKQNAKAPVKTVQMRMTQVISERETPLVYSSADLIKSIKIDASSTWLYSGAKKATVVLVDTIPGLLKYAWVVELGIVDPTTSEIDYITLGTFVTDRVDVNYEKGTTTLALYDYMSKADKAWQDNTHTNYPKTVSALANGIATNIGCDGLEDMTGLPNVDQIVQEDLWALISQEKYRDVINEIANITASTAIVNSRNYLEFVPFAEPIETLTYDNLKKYKLGLPYGKVNSVVLSRQPQNDDVAQSDDVSINENGLTEIKIVNNEIADDDRTSFITPLFNKLNGISFNGIEIDTEGHGWYEIGDTLSVAETDASEANTIVVTDYTLNLDSGGFKETIKCVTPNLTSTDYTATGGIKKSIYNTEIKTDKQQQEITSIVSRQDIFENQVNEEFTQVYQNIEGLTVSVQTTGGGNYIKNSVGYSKDADNNLINWTFAGSGNYSSQTSPESMQAGAIEGNQISLFNGTLTQRIVLAPNIKYVLSYIGKKSVTGVAGVIIRNDNEQQNLLMPDQQSVYWKKQEITFTPTLGYVDIIITANADVTEFAITDLMLSQGDLSTPWRQADGEILNTQVAVDTEGIRVKSSVYEGDETVMTPLEFAGYSSVSGSKTKVFSLNRDTTEVQKISVQQQISMPPLKVIPLDSPSGWAFVKEGE